MGSLVVVLVAAVLLAGCGGAETAAPTTDAAGGAAPQNPAGAASQTVSGSDPAAAGAAGDTAASTTPESPGKVVAPGDQVATTTATPAAFAQALGHRSIVVFFYEPGSTADEVFRRQVHAAVKRYPGVLYLEYTPARYKQSGDLVEQLGLFDMPAVAIVNRQGELQNFKSMYWPATLIARSISRAEAVPRAKVAPTDAPAAEPTDNVETLVADTARLEQTSNG